MVGQASLHDIHTVIVARLQHGHALTVRTVQHLHGGTGARLRWSDL